MGFSLGKALGGAVAGFATGGWTGAALGAVAGGIDAYTDKSAYNYQQKQNLALWNMQNAYNSPKEQMQRYREANLNPNLIYSQQNTAGDIAGATLNQTSDALGKANTLANSKMQRMSQYQGILSANAYMQQVNAQTEKIHNDIKIANTLLPYQREALKADIASKTADLSSPAGLARWIGRENASKLIRGGNNTSKSIFEKSIDKTREILTELGFGY